MCHHFDRFLLQFEPPSLLKKKKKQPKNQTKIINMDNISDIVDDRSVHDERSDRSDSPQPKDAHSGEARVQLLSEVQVHASAEDERGSPAYMDVRDEEERGCSSSSSSDDEEEKREEREEEKEVEAEAEPEPEAEAEPDPEPEPEKAPESTAEEVNGETHDGSRRSSASSASSGSHGPSDDPAIQAGTLEEQEEVVEDSLKTLETVTLDAEPADPDHPEISLFVKVRFMDGSTGKSSGFPQGDGELRSFKCVTFKGREIE